MEIRVSGSRRTCGSMHELWLTRDGGAWRRYAARSCAAGDDDGAGCNAPFRLRAIRRLARRPVRQRDCATT